MHCAFPPPFLTVYISRCLPFSLFTVLTVYPSLFHMKQAIHKIGVVTSGGDVPGLNAAIRAITRMGTSLGVEIIGVQRGYAGLIDGDFTPLTNRSVSGVLQQGGTILGTARCKQFETDEGRRLAARNLADAEIDALIVIGGNGSLRGAMELHKLGVPLIGVPKTIDNDQFGTDMAIGVDTALNTIVEAVSRIKDTASSHHRAFLVETMGRGCGYLALVSAITSGAEMALIPEYPDSLEDVAASIFDSYRLGKKHCIIMVAEGWKPGVQALKTFLHEHDASEQESGYDVREVILGHVQRGGSPTPFDRLLATRLGAKAIELLVAGKGNGTMVGLQGSQIKTISLQEATSNERVLDPELIKLAKVLAL